MTAALQERLEFARTLPTAAALRALVTVVDGARASGDEVLLASALHDRARLLVKRGAFLDALEAAQEAQLIAVRLGERGDEAELRLLTARALERLGCLDQATEQAQAALVASQDRRDPNGERRALMALGSLCLAHGRPEEARPLLVQADAHRAGAEPIEAAELLTQLYGVHLRLGRPQEATPYARAAFDVVRAHGLTSAEGMLTAWEAFDHAARGETETALTLYERAVSLVRRGGEVAHLLDFQLRQAALLTRREPERARQTLDEIAERAGSLGMREWEARAHELLADLHDASGDALGALAHLRRLRALEQELAQERASARLEALGVMHRVREAEAERELYRLRHVELSRALEDVREANARLEALAERDELTDLHNRRYASAWLAAAWNRADREGRTVALALLDVDNFKGVNDGYGHPIGDAVLRAVADVLRREVGPPHLVARFGGEEFVLAWSGLPEAEVLARAEFLRRALESTDWSHLVPGRVITATIGVWVRPPGADLAELGVALDLADRALLLGKREGRNRVVRAPDRPTS